MIRYLKNYRLGQGNRMTFTNRNYQGVYEFYFDRLIDAQAFEFVSFLMQQITEKQILNRLKWRKKQAEQDIENLEKWKAWMRHQLFKERFLNDYSPN